MEKIKYMFMAVLVALVSMTVTSCSDDDDDENVSNQKNPASMIVGTYTGTLREPGFDVGTESAPCYVAFERLSNTTVRLTRFICEKYGIDDYVDLCLAMIEQESGGNPPDVMQTAQSYYNVNPPIDSAEESIDCGTHELSDCLTKAKCKDPNDINGISLALQGYNFGNGYIDWALKNYGCYTKENAQIFSVKMCAELGYVSYGDVEYVPHVLRYYVMNEETSVSNESAKTILEELKKNNTAPAEAWDVIEKGASLIGSVKYSMEKRQADGRDKPEFLDCSSFSAWAFHKAGVTSVPYGSTTATFIGSKKFHDISADQLQPGDIGPV